MMIKELRVEVEAQGEAKAGAGAEVEAEATAGVEVTLTATPEAGLIPTPLTQDPDLDPGHIQGQDPDRTLLIHQDPGQEPVPLQFQGGEDLQASSTRGG